MPTYKKHKILKLNACASDCYRIEPYGKCYFLCSSTILHIIYQAYPRTIRNLLLTHVSRRFICDKDCMHHLIPRTASTRPLRNATYVQALSQFHINHVLPTREARIHRKRGEQEQNREPSSFTPLRYNRDPTDGRSYDGGACRFELSPRIKTAFFYCKLVPDIYRLIISNI